MTEKNCTSEAGSVIPTFCSSILVDDVLTQSASLWSERAFYRVVKVEQHGVYVHRYGFKQTTSNDFYAFDTFEKMRLCLSSKSDACNYFAKKLAREVCDLEEHKKNMKYIENRISDLADIVTLLAD